MVAGYVSEIRSIIITIYTVHLGDQLTVIIKFPG